MIVDEIPDIELDRIRIGDEIPDLESDAFHEGEIKKIKLSEYRGKWLVLMFYPADFTFVCPTELRDMAKVYDKFTSEGAEVMSVSTDTAYVHKAWHDSSEAVGGVSFPMLADPTGAMSSAFGTYNEANGLSWRATFIIDPNGIVKAMDIHDNSIGRSVKEIFRKLAASKFVHENPGVACPAGWEPGDDFLEPSVDMIGKI